MLEADWSMEGEMRGELHGGTLCDLNDTLENELCLLMNEAERCVQWSLQGISRMVECGDDHQPQNIWN